MRSKFIWIVGSLLIVLWAITMTFLLFGKAADDPLRLEISDPGWLGRIGTTTTPLIEAMVFIPSFVLFVALVITLARKRTKRDQDRPTSWLEDLRQQLRRDYPKYSDRGEKRK